MKPFHEVGWHVHCAALPRGGESMKCLNPILMLAFAAVLFATPLSAQERKVSYRIDDRAYDTTSEMKQVEGRWYTNGERRKPATIISSRLRGI